MEREIPMDAKISLLAIVCLLQKWKQSDMMVHI